MRNNTIYKALKQLILDNNYTVEQLQQLGFNEARQLLGNPRFSVTFFNNMKRGLIDTLQARDDKADCDRVKGRIKTWLDTNYPNCEIERGRESGKPVIKLWLKGKPNAGNSV